MSKKKEEVLIKEKEKFVSRSIQNGYSEEVSNKVYELILRFASFGFNRSHSVAYAMVAYKMAYLKAHYPNVFLKNLLSTYMNSEGKTKEYIYECKLNNIEILNPDINYSTHQYEVQNGRVRYPFNIIKGVGETAIQNILEERTQNKFIDVYDFLARCGKNINRKVLENLIYAGCFESLSINKKTFIENMDVLLNYSELASYLDSEFALKPELVEYKEYDKKECMEKEYNVFGFYLSDHPVTEYKAKYKEFISIEQMEKYFDKVVNCVVYVENIKEIVTKKGDKMLFITGSDEVNIMDIVLFPKVYEKCTEINLGDILYINGKVEKRFDKLQLVVNTIKKLS